MSDLTWRTDWESVVCYNDMILPNHYDLIVHFNVSTEDDNEQNIAFDRIKYFVDNILQDAIFCGMNDERAPFYMNTYKQKLVTFVAPPQDLVIVATLFSKFISIVEGRIEIEKLELNSKVGNRVTINFDMDFAEESNMLKSDDLVNATKKDPWWNRSDCGTADYFMEDAEDEKKLIFVTDVTSWDTADLQWTENKSKVAKSEASWNPTIIPGGKTHH